MAWEERRGHPYYYRSVREGNRVRKVYLGGGVLGEIAALQDEYERLRREEKAAYWKEERECLEREVAFLQKLEEAAQIITQAHLIADGCHRHKGTWRRSRETSA